MVFTYSAAAFLQCSSYALVSISFSNSAGADSLILQSQPVYGVVGVGG